MVQVDTFGTGKFCADDCLATATRVVFDLTPAGRGPSAGIIRQLDLLMPRYRTGTAGQIEALFQGGI